MGKDKKTACISAINKAIEYINRNNIERYSLGNPFGSYFKEITFIGYSLLEKDFPDDMENVGYYLEYSQGVFKLKFYYECFLRLPLKKKWFDLTKSGIKTEDYREINEYWCRRLMNFKEPLEQDVMEELISDLRNFSKETIWHRRLSIEECIHNFGCSFKPFTTNRMTLGYPKSTDADRILEYAHDGIEIRTGNPEWGAEEGKMYFVIKHRSRK